MKSNILRNSVAASFAALTLGSNPAHAAPRAAVAPPQICAVANHLLGRVAVVATQHLPDTQSRAVAHFLLRQAHGTVQNFCR